MPERLILMRHAKSDYPPGVPDHDRPLSDRGRRDAAAASAWLVEHRSALVSGRLQILVSSATRAQQTWEIAGDAFADGVRTEPAIYEAAVSTLIDLAAGCPAETVMIVGHNPTLESCLAHLAGDSGARVMKTCAIGALALHDADPFASATAEVIAFHTPRAG